MKKYYVAVDLEGVACVVGEHGVGLGQGKQYAFAAEAPIPGSLEAIIAANAAAAALRSRAFSDAALEEATAEDREIAEPVEETPIEEPAADESVEAEPAAEAAPAAEPIKVAAAEPATAAEPAAETTAVAETEATAEAQVKEAPAPVKAAHTRPAHRPEPLRAAKSRTGRSGHPEGRVSMREAARRAGLSKD